MLVNTVKIHFTHLKSKSNCGAVGPVVEVHNSGNRVKTVVRLLVMLHNFQVYG